MPAGLIGMGLTRADKWLAALLVAVALAGIGLELWLLPQPGSKVVQIWQDGRLVRTVTLREGYHEEIRLGGASRFNIVEIDGTRVRVRDADCPDRLCVRTGWVMAEPQQVVCLPYRVVVKVVSSVPPDVDTIVR
ncbi:protein of unknown function DUF1312 [Thermosinus carboxydivorans Nor1]|uniref:Uncharacterized protein n=2 Tax=Thermosinus TaxID=261684 RepID=A1HP09_9FIRM|nr:protein of unknown function DUF1312 [Thermosinus carboxydivorans Nor1]